MDPCPHLLAVLVGAFVAAADQADLPVTVAGVCFLQRILQVIAFHTDHIGKAGDEVRNDLFLRRYVDFPNARLLRHRH